MRSWITALALTLGWLLAGSGPAVAEGEQDSPQAKPGAAPALSDLMHVPQGYGLPTSAEVAGTSEARWRGRFRSALGRLAEAREKLIATRRELDGMAGQGGASQWSVAPPTAGAAPSSSPLSFKLRQALKAQRGELEEAERGLRELRIEADLAGVPQSWRGDEGVEIGVEARTDLTPP